MSNVFALGDWKCPCGNVDASRQEVYIRKLLSRGKMAHVFLDYSYCKGFDRAAETGKLEKAKRYKTKEPNKVGMNGMRR